LRLRWDVVQAIAGATKSEELLREFLEELKGLRQDFDEDRAERALREGPYSGVYRYAPANKAEWLACHPTTGSTLRSHSKILLWATAAILRCRSFIFRR
jgi:hypothetical protein